MPDDIELKKEQPSVSKEAGFVDLDKTVVRIVEQTESAPPAVAPILPIEASGKSMLGKTVAGNIVIKAMIGSGGMSCVYRGEQASIGRAIAVKMMHPHLLSDDTAMLRFNQEAQAIGKLDHPNIVRVHDFRAGDNGNSYLVMDLVEGKSLSDVIEEEGVVPAERAIDIFTQACDGLQHAHSKGIVHRDLKPSNIMLVQGDDGKQQVKILDFGIAKILPQQGDNRMKLTQTGEVFGSPLYMSPEQCMGKPVDPRSDIYAMGCLIFESLTGKPPFEGANAFDTFFKHTTELPPSIKDLRPDFAQAREFDAIILKAMAKDPKDRYQSMTQLKIDLLKLREHYDKGFLGKFSDDVEFARRKFGAQGKVTPKMILLISAFALLVVGTAGGSLYYYQNFAVNQTMSWDKLFLSGQESFDKGDYSQASRQFEAALNAANMNESKMLPALYELVNLQIAQGKSGSSAYATQITKLEKERDDAVTVEVGELKDEFVKAAQSGDSATTKEKMEDLAQQINDKTNLLINPSNEARKSLDDSLKTMLSTYEASKDETAEGYARTLYTFAMSKYFRNNYKDAIPLLEKSAELRKAQVARDPVNVRSYLLTLNWLAKANFNSGNLDKAEEIFKTRLTVARKGMYDDQKGSVVNNSGVAQAKFNLAEFYYYSRHNIKAAKSQVREAIQIYEHLESPEPEDQGGCYAMLGIIELTEGDRDTAEKNFQIAQRIFEPLHFKSNVFWVETLRGLAECAYAKKNYSVAEPLFRRALAVGLACTPQYIISVNQCLNRLDEIAQAKGVASSEELFAINKRRLSIDAGRYGMDSARVVEDYIMLSDLARRHGELKQSRDFLAQASAITEKIAGRDSWTWAELLYKRGQLDFDSGRKENGEACFDQMVSLVERLESTAGEHKQLLQEMVFQVKTRMRDEPEMAGRLEAILKASNVL